MSMFGRLPAAGAGFSSEEDENMFGPLAAGAATLQAGLAIGGGFNRNSQIDSQIKANRFRTAQTLAELNDQAKANIDDRRREADSIIGSIRAAAGGSGAAAPLAVLRNVDFSRGRADDRVRKNVANQTLAIRTQQAIQEARLKNSKQSPLEIILGGLSSGGQTLLATQKIEGLL